MRTLFNLVFYNPLYNGLIFLIAILPYKDVGIAVILFTILIKLILFPLTKSSLITQIKMRTLEPQMKEIRDKYKDNREELARKTLEFYRENKIKPFSSFLLVLIQFPIIIALYFVFLKAGLPNVNTELLYSFVPVPMEINMKFLGLIDIVQPSIILGAIAAVTQYIQARLSLPPLPDRKNSGKEKSSFGEDFAHSMNLQMKYVFPVIVFISSFYFSGAIALYWLTGNIFTIGQEIYLRQKKLK
jgi:YidC/Oxa1 family membrane protein insertase